MLFRSMVWIGTELPNVAENVPLLFMEAFLLVDGHELDVQVAHHHECQAVAQESDICERCH